MPDIYTKEMRINHEACPICGFWHSALSCPLQVAGMSNQILALRAEIERLRKVINNIKFESEFSVTYGRSGSLYINTKSESDRLVKIAGLATDALNSFQNGNSSIGDMTSPVGESEDIIAKTRLTYNADTVTLEVKKADKGDYLLIQNLWQYSYYDTLEEAMESYNHKRDLFLGQGYKESEEE